MPGWVHVPHGGVGAWHSVALTAGAALSQIPHWAVGLGPSTGGIWDAALTPSISSPSATSQSTSGPWAPVQLPCCSQNLPAPSGCRAGGTYGIWWPGSPWDRVPPALSHSPHPRPPMVPSPGPHPAPGEPGELLPLHCALSQRQSPNRPFRGCPGVSPMATPHSSEAAASTCSLPTGTSLPSRTERSVAIPSPAKKRTTLVSAVGWGHGGQPVPTCLPGYRGR